MRGMFARGWLLAALVAGGSIASACGGGEEGPAEQVRAALADTREAFDGGDVAGACSSITRAAARSVGQDTCPQALGGLLDPAKRSLSDERSGERRVLDVEVRGARATAKVTLNAKVPGTVSLVRRDGRWKLDDLGVAPIKSESRSRSFNSPGQQFEVWRQRGERRIPCPPISRVEHGGDSEVDGGCLARLSSDRVEVLVLTALGDFRIARCGAELSVRLDNTGNVIANDVVFRGAAPCGEIRHCVDGETGLRYPWQGQKVHPRYGGVALSYDVCVNTPAGRARGFQIYELTRDGDAWSAALHDYPVGDSSIQMGGKWKVVADDLRIGPGFDPFATGRFERDRRD